MCVQGWDRPQSRFRIFPLHKRTTGSKMVRKREKKQLTGRQPMSLIFYFSLRTWENQIQVHVVRTCRKAFDSCLFLCCKPDYYLVLWLTNPHIITIKTFCVREPVQGCLHVCAHVRYACVIESAREHSVNGFLCCLISHIWQTANPAFKATERPIVIWRANWMR